MAELSLDEAELLAIYLETFLYGESPKFIFEENPTKFSPSGIFFTLFWIALWILWIRRTEAKNNRSLIIVLSLMLVLSTSVGPVESKPILTRLSSSLQHITIAWLRVIEAFIFHGDLAHGGPIGSPCPSFFVAQIDFLSCVKGILLK